jgi:hypothetical protein
MPIKNLLIAIQSVLGKTGGTSLTSPFKRHFLMDRVVQFYFPIIGTLLLPD